MADLNPIRELIQQERFDEAFAALEMLDDPEARELQRFVGGFIRRKTDPALLEAHASARQAFLDEAVKREQSIFFWVAMTCYLASAIISIINPSLHNRTASQVELWLNSLFHIILILVGVLAYLYSRQKERIRRRLSQSAITAGFSRGPALITIMGSLVLILSSNGAPIWMLCGILLLIYGGLQWRWLGVARGLASIDRMTTD